MNYGLFFRRHTQCFHSFLQASVSHYHTTRATFSRKIRKWVRKAPKQQQQLFLGRCVK